MPIALQGRVAQGIQGHMQASDTCRAWQEQTYLNRQQATPDLNIGAARVVPDKIEKSNAERKENDHACPQALVKPDQDAAHPAYTIPQRYTTNH